MSVKNRSRWVGAAWIGLIAALGVAHAKLEMTAAAQGANKPQAPMFEVDPFWPKPLPNHWLLGSTIGVWADDQDHVWIIHRSSATLDDNERGAELKPPRYECCVGAPPVLAFDREGNLVHHWGGPGQGYEWPDSNHGIVVDHGGNVWIAGNGGPDGHVLKFTREGKFLAQYGKKGARPGPPATGGAAGGGQTWRADSNDPQNFGRPAKIFIDPKANEAYIADGYLNRRVAVVDAQSGKMKRYWGAYGNKPDDSDLGAYDPSAPPAKQFRNPVHCAMLSNDGLVYVCDRQGDRIQVFRPNGTFVNEAFLAKNTRGSGSVWDIAFSSDPQQRFLYVADGGNAKVYILERASLQLLTSFGEGGRQPGQFFGVHSIATDSMGNLYTTETYEGKRLQKFIYKGLGPVTQPHQGVLWPRRSSQ
jgi:DNA-binding beta-propeller fold protein YncE